jgi:pyridoxine/pyridoxamine 5'-phosphate oxidase
MSNEKNNTVGNANSTQSEPIKTEVELLRKLTELVSEYQDYEAPRIRSDGDIIICLNSDLKRNRQAFQSLADAVQLMMERDKPKRYR